MLPLLLVQWRSFNLYPVGFNRIRTPTTTAEVGVPRKDDEEYTTKGVMHKLRYAPNEKHMNYKVFE